MENEIKREYWPNGNLCYERSYVNGVRHGLQKWYHSNGQLGDQCHMKDGQFHGMDQNWWRDEKINYVNQWKNDDFNGPEIVFYY